MVRSNPHVFRRADLRMAHGTRASERHFGTMTRMPRPDIRAERRVLENRADPKDTGGLEQPDVPARGGSTRARWDATRQLPPVLSLDSLIAASTGEA